MSQDSDVPFPLSQGTWGDINNLLANGPRILSQSDVVNVDSECFDGGYVHLEGERYTVGEFPLQFDSVLSGVQLPLSGAFTTSENGNVLLPSEDEIVNPGELVNNDNMAPIPANTSWPGPHGFEICFEPQTGNPKKGKSWIYSEQLDKLFINIDTQCKLRFKVENFPPIELGIRAMPIFTKDEDLQKVVKRCHNHSSNSKDTIAPDHFVRCENLAAFYEDDPHTGRQSVIIPFNKPQAGNAYTEELFKFMCLNSCMSLKGRHIQIVFTLERNDSGEVVGRCPLDIRVCACPGRDSKAEEISRKKKSLVRTTSLEMSYATTVKRRRGNEQEGAQYPVMVDSLAKQKIMCKFRDLLDGYDLIPRKEATNRPQVAEALGRTLSNSSMSSLYGPSTSTSATHQNGEVNGVVAVKKEQKSIQDWLESIGKAAYTDQFAKHGFYFMDQIEKLTKEDLGVLRIGKQHMDDIWKELDLYCQVHSCNGSAPNSQSSQTNQAPRAIEITRLKFSKVVPLNDMDSD